MVIENRRVVRIDRFHLRSKRLGRFAAFADGDQAADRRRRARRTRPILRPRPVSCLASWPATAARPGGSAAAMHRADGSRSQRHSADDLADPHTMFRLIIRDSQHAPAHRRGLGSEQCSRTRAVAGDDHPLAASRAQTDRPPAAGRRRACVPSARYGCTTSSFHPCSDGCFTVEVAVPMTRPSCMARSCRSGLSALWFSENPQIVDQRAAPLAGERQRRRHAFAGRRRRSRTTGSLRRPGRATPCTGRSSRTASCPSIAAHLGHVPHVVASG